MYFFINLCVVSLIFQAQAKNAIRSLPQVGPIEGHRPKGASFRPREPQFHDSKRYSTGSFLAQVEVIKILRRGMESSGNTGRGSLEDHAIAIPTTFVNRRVQRTDGRQSCRSAIYPSLPQNFYRRTGSFDPTTEHQSSHVGITD